MTRPCVSVIMANYNGARHLAAAVRSVLNQTLESLELLIADDASTDDSLDIIEAAAGSDPRVRVLSTTVNAGPGAARNRALSEACGEFIAVFDSDDLMAPDRLERLVTRAKVDRADIVVDNLLVFQDGCASRWRPFLHCRGWSHPRTITLADYIEAGRMYSKAPGLGYLKPLFRAELLADMRYREDLRIGEDYDLVLRLLAKGAVMRYQPDTLYRYRKHGASISHVMRREHIEQMLAADAALDAELAKDAAVRRAQALRRRSLQTALNYDHVISSLKARKLASAAATCIADPSVCPLLMMPVKARLRRLVERPALAA